MEKDYSRPRGGSLRDADHLTGDRFRRMPALRYWNTMTSFVVPNRFCGPPDSGNGGYTCGMVAKELGGAVECTLRMPVPLNVSLRIERTEKGAVLRDDDKVVIEAVPTTVDIDPPATISFEAATTAMASSAALDPRHPFPTCFVCGPKRGVHDGLRIFPAPIAGGQYAAAWVPDHEFGDDQHILRSEFLWAAMDCPTGFASGFPSVGKLVTGRLAVEQLRPILTGENCVLMSWPLGVEGRKHFSAACLYQQEELCAVGRATWIKVEG
jgi:hypothetical protein